MTDKDKGNFDRLLKATRDFEEDAENLKKKTEQVREARKFQQMKRENKRVELLQDLTREQLKRAAKVLKLKGFSNKNKNQLIAMVLKNRNKLSDAEYRANEAILVVRESLGLSTSGNLKNPTKGIRISKKEAAKPAKQQADEALKMVKAALKASSEMPKLRQQLIRRIKKEYEPIDKPSIKKTLKTREERNKSAKASADLISEV